MDIDVTISNDVTMRGGVSSALGCIDQYELLRELGGGGFGCVFLAKDTVAGIEVAVKGLPPEVRHNKEELENIRANFALVSRLHYPNIAAALVLHPAKEVSYANRDVMEKLRVFERDTMMVMEYAPGVTLSQWRKQFPEKKVPLEKALDITRQVAAALDYAHGEKIVHRDVKPSNVMIETKADGSVVARVLDFGLAAEIRSSMGRVSREIRDTSGTRPYMAPEQWRGAKQGPATDQYALAAMFCELVTGEVPFASVFDTGDPVVMLTNVTTLPPELPDSLPRGCKKTLLKALAKKPEERFESCGALAAALSSGGRARTPRIAPASQLVSLGGYPAAPMLWMIVTVILLAMAAVGGWWWRERVKSEELRVKTEVLAAERARQSEERRQAEEKRQAEDAKRKAGEVKRAEETRIAAEKAEAERKAKAESERKAKLEAERIAAEKAEAERKAKLEAERVAEEERKAEEARIAKEKRRAAEAVKPVPQKMLEALAAMGLDFAKCECDEYAALGIPLMSAILSFAQDLDNAKNERRRLLETLTENHPQVLGQGKRMEADKRHLAESISMSAEIVERYAASHDADEKSVLALLEADILPYEFFERKIPVSLKVRLRVFYDAYIAGFWKRRDLLTVYTDEHPEVKAVDGPMREAEKSFKANVRAYRVSYGWIKEPQPHAAEERTGKVEKKTVTARQACDFCKGTGRRPCLECGPIRNQAGEVVCEHGITCSVCGGSGSRSVGGLFPEPCSDCRGRGWERHVKCAGSGFLPGVCAKCDGKRVICTETE